MVSEVKGEKKNRPSLKSAFLEGKKPTEQDFADVFESFLNLDEEGIIIDKDKNLKIGRSVSLTDEGNLNVAGNITGQGDLTIDGLMKAESLNVSGEIDTASLKVGQEGLSISGSLNTKDAKTESLKVTSEAEIKSLTVDGNASFTEVKVEKLSIGDDEWEVLPKELWKETQLGSIQYEGTVTIAGEDPELVLEGKASIDEIAAGEITLAGTPLLPSEWEKENENLQYLGTVEVEELKLLGAIAESSFNDLEEATTFLENQSNIELKAHIASLHGILRHLIDEVKALKMAPIDPNAQSK